MKKFISSILLIVIILSSSAQESITLSMKEAIDLALENNSSLKQSSTKSMVAQAEYLQSSASFLPSVDFSISGLRTNDPLSSFGFKLKQEVVEESDFNPALLNNPVDLNHFNMQLQVQLPILNMDGLYQRSAAKLGFEASQLQHQRTIAFIKFQVKKVYFQTILNKEAITVVNESLQSANSALELSLNLFDQGFIKEADLLLAKVNLSDLQNKLKEAKHNYLASKEELLHLLGLNLHLELTLSSDIDNTANYTSLQNISSDLLRRSDIKAYQKGIEAQKQLKNASAMQFIPRINAFGSTEWNDNKFLGTQATNYTIGAMLSWKLFNGQKNIGRLKKAKANLAHTQESYDEYLSKSKLELNQAERKLKIHKENITTAKLNLEYAEESKRMIKNRYKQGLEKTIDLLYAENLASNRRLLYLQSKYQYQIQKNYLELLVEKELNNL